MMEWNSKSIKKYITSMKEYVGKPIKLKSGLWTFEFIDNPIDPNSSKEYVVPTKYNIMLREHSRIKAYTALQLMNRYTDDQIAEVMTYENLSCVGKADSMFILAIRQLENIPPHKGFSEALGNT